MAWSHPADPKTGERVEVYSCHELCRDSPAEQSRLRCSLEGADESSWGKADTPMRGPHMGRLPVLQPEPDERDPRAPGESNESGCPGSWYRTPWALSVCVYERSCDQHGGLNDNVHLTRSDDRVLHDAVSYLEGQRARARDRDWTRSREGK